jgi:hypothetical protein
MITLKNWRERMRADMGLRDYRARTKEGYELATRLFLDWAKTEPEELPEEHVPLLSVPARAEEAGAVEHQRRRLGAALLLHPHAPSRLARVRAAPSQQAADVAHGAEHTEVRALLASRSLRRLVES